MFPKAEAIMRVISFSSLVLIVACTKPPTTTEKLGVYVQVKKTSLEGKLSWRGAVKSSKRIEIRADRRFKIHKVAVSNLNEVQKNQLLVEVDQSEIAKKKVDINDKLKTFSLEMDSQRIKFAQVEKELQRKKILFGRGVIPKKDFDNAERDFRLAQTEQRQKALEKERLTQEAHEIEASIKNANFYAPITGIISGLEALNTPDGEIAAGTLIAIVSDPKSLALSVPIEETALDRVKAGNDVSISWEGSNTETMSGKILEIAKTPIEAEGRIKTFEMLISLSASKVPVREGTTGRATMTYARKENVLSVPLVSLRQMDGRDFVMAASTENGEAKPKNVKVGLKTDSEVEILSGISEGEYVLVDNS